MYDRFLSRGKLKADNLPHKKGDWVFGYFVILKDGDRDIPCIYGFGEVFPATVGRFTGLTDKNGKRIFEEDIVSLPDEDEVGIIRWDDDSARFIIEADNGCLSCDFDNYYGYELEVIGNFRDTPELL